MAVTQFIADNVTPVITKNAPFDRSPTAGALTTVQLDPGATYHRLYMRFTKAGVAATQAEILAQVAKLQFWVNSDEKRTWQTPEGFLYDSAFYYASRNPTMAPGGDIVEDGVVVIDLAPEWMSNPANREILAYGTKNKNNVSLGITWGPVPLTIDLVEIEVETTKATALGTHITRRESIFNNSSTGKIQNNNITRTPGARVLRLDIIKNDGTAHTISEINLNIDNSPIRQSALVGVMLKRSHHLGHYNGYFQNILSIDFTARDREIDAIPAIWESFQLEMTVSAALNSYSIVLFQEEVDQVVIQAAPPSA